MSALRASLICALAITAGCHPGASARAVDNRGGGDGNQVLATVFGVAFPAVHGGDDVEPETAGLVAYRIEPDQATVAAAVAPISEDQRMNSEGQPSFYDLDRDGTADLFLYPQVYFGPSAGHMVHVRGAGGFRQVFAGPGQLTVTPVAGRLVLHDEIYIIDGAESRLGYNAVYDLAARTWSEGPATYHATWGEMPAQVDTPRRFTVAAAATLRATRRIDDAAVAPPEDGEGVEQTVTLRGNVLADYGPGARGWVVARHGDWLFVAFDPAVRPRATSMGHGMRDDDIEIPEEAFGDDAAMARYGVMLRSATWLCGWVAAGDLELS